MKRPRYTPEMVYDIRHPTKNSSITASKLAAKYDISPTEISTIRNLPDEVFLTEEQFLASKIG